MHSLNFQLKRAHLKTVAFSEKLVEKVKGMTAARFDLLYLLRRPDIEWRRAPPILGLPYPLPLTQMGLRRQLGISRPTVSKMLKRLEEMGWIKRERCPEDKRTKIVRLTQKGLLRIWRAMRRVFRPKVVRKKYEKLFASGADVDVITRLMNLWADIDRIARHFGDRSSAWYHYGQYED